MEILKSAFVKEFIKLTNDGTRMGWHERNGGNLSYRIATEEAREIEGELSPGGEWKPIGRALPDLAGEFFLVTGTGKYFSNVILDPEDNITIAELDAEGRNYRQRWGLSRGGAPTSEFASHLVCHAAKKRESGGRSRVVYHAHPGNIIAMTFLLPLSDRVFTLELWRMISECSIVFPKGVGVTEWMVPGSEEMADATAREIAKFDAVIWPHHGMFATGATFDEAFGLMYTIEKAAEIWIKIKSTGMPILQSITVDNLKALEQAFHIRLTEGFLSGE
ncbi:MAG: rhamnulose-1-phosphate aldolase [Clostridiales bacterium]|jgi:rhamnulose-1-phosphate aldolase|nr:rhamnulose-1-phosphate aldolase [Clostridiales bacterium]